MTFGKKIQLRLSFLIRVTYKQCRYLLITDQQLFEQPFTCERAQKLDTDLNLAERVEAFVSRFGRLQDTVGDKLLPTLLIVLGEKPGAVIDNLDRAERLGFLRSADEWITMRQLRNQMIHEYIEDMEVLTHALNTGHAFVPTLVNIANKMIAEAERRING
ncbi:MAG: hypothetical protein IPG31_09245 [Nitrosomonas sp.]|nr:hypothetical protein [Nitrosomonas sp.]